MQNSKQINIKRKSLKQKINEFLEKMAKENEKSFGSCKLDCCQLNKKTK